MKTIIAVWHTAQKGKTETLKELAKSIVSAFTSCKVTLPSPFKMPVNGDVRVVMEVNKKIIVIETQGDPKTNLEDRLFEIDKIYNPDIIFCATRTSGETVNAVETLANVKNYDVIWTSTYQNQNMTTTLNKVKADHLLDLIKQLKLI